MRKEEFLKDIDNWSNHRYLLWPALEATKHIGLPVLELGCGNGSTPYLQKYCSDNELRLGSFDFDKEWADKFDANYISNWDDIIFDSHYSVVLVDHSPGEHRKEALKKLTHSKIIIIHDSEPAGWNASDYQVREQFGLFKYVFDLKSEEPEGAWATALSNTIDVTKFEL